MIVSKFLPAVVLAAAALCSGVANAQGALNGLLNAWERRIHARWYR